MSDLEAEEENRLPESQFAPLARLCKWVALLPISLEPEVQKGTMLLPEKS